MSAKETSLHTKVWYWKRAARNKINKTSSSFEEKKLGVDVRYLENEIVKLQEKLENKSNEKNLNFYENGKYNNYIPMVYVDLLSMGLSSRNVEKCVCLILENLAKVKVGRLPEKTFTKNVFLEATCLAQIHVASVLSKNQGNLALHSDGTTKHGRLYTTYDVQSGEDVLVAGMREIGGADALSQLDLFHEYLDEVGQNLGK